MSSTPLQPPLFRHFVWMSIPEQGGDEEEKAIKEMSDEMKKGKL